MNLALSLQHMHLAIFIKASCREAHDKISTALDGNFMLKHNPT